MGWLKVGLAVIIGVAVVVGVFMVFSSLVDREKHKHIRNFLLIIAFPFLLLIPASLVIDQTVCSMELTNTTTYYVYGDNFTAGEHWDNYSINDAPAFNPSDKVAFLFHIDTDNVYAKQCYTQSNGSTAFFKGFAIVLGIFVIYVFILFAGDILKAFKELVRK